MTTNAEAVAALVKAKATLQAQCDGASGATLDQLISSIHALTSEIGALEAKALDNGDYVPTTDPFKNATAEGQAFLTKLNNLKNTFAKAEAVAGALDTVINLVSKLAV